MGKIKQIFNQVIGISNTLPDKQFVFMCEFDNINFETVEEITKFISSLFEIDIDILESSKNNYHLVSYDIIDLNLLEKIYCWIEFPTDSDFIPIDEIPLYNVEAYTLRLTQKHLPIGVALRLSNKFNKQSPRFIKRIQNKKPYYLKSYEHLRFYKLYCYVPDFDNAQTFLTLPVQIVKYNVGIGSKSKKGRRTSLEQKVYNKLNSIIIRVQK